jgi:Heterokaryon incompatibility protein Het-C
VSVRSPRGERVPPLVTGTFGSADFLHSLLGEATDHLSEASLTDLTQHLGSAAAQSQSQGTSPIQTLTNLFSKIPSMGGTNDKLQQGESMKKKAINLDVNKVAPKDVQKQLWDVLVWRDGLMKGVPRLLFIDIIMIMRLRHTRCSLDISNTIAKIPGLESLLDQFTEALNVCEWLDVHRGHILRRPVTLPPRCLHYPRAFYDSTHSPPV